MFCHKILRTNIIFEIIINYLILVMKDGKNKNTLNFIGAKFQCISKSFLKLLIILQEI